MMKNIIVSSLISAILLFSGCSNNDGESRLEVQQMLDNGDYDGVIAKLGSSASTDDEYLALAAAYMGNSGLGFSDLVSVMAASNDTGSGGDGFANFAQTLASSTKDSALVDLGKAVDNYEKVVGTACTDGNATNSQKDICLFIGLSSTMKAATTFSYIADSLEGFGAGSGSDDKLAASACAMGYAFNGIVGAGCSITPPTADANITFIPAGKTYTELAVTVNSNTFEYFMTTDSAIRQTIITNGYCDVNFTKCDANETIPNDGCYVCPVSKEAGAEELTLVSALVDTLDSGLDAVIATLGGGDSTIADDVEKYKVEVQDENGTITVESIIDYINLQNQ